MVSAGYIQILQIADSSLQITQRAISHEYLSMSKKYNIPRLKQERKLMEVWDKQYPMTQKKHKRQYRGDNE